MLGKTFCCERAVVFEEEVSVHTIEKPGVGARVTLAVATDRGDQVFVSVAAWRSSRIEGPGYVIKVNAPIGRLFKCPLAHSARREARDFKL